MTKAVKEKTVGKKHRFGFGLLVYAWILLIVGGIFLFLLQDVLTAYEASLPKHCVEDYGLALKETLPPAAVEALAELDPEICSPEENARWAEALLQEASLVKESSPLGEDVLIYRIQAADGQTLGQVRFGVVGEQEYGFPLAQALSLASRITSGDARRTLPVWGVVEEQFDFSAYYKTVGITVPPYYRVYLGNRLLGPEAIVEDGIPYDALAECYQHYENLPTLVRYESTPFVGEPVLRVCDENGAELPADAISEETFLDHCSPEIRELVDAYVPEFVHLYVLFSSDMYNSSYYYYDLLKQLVVVPDSQLHNRMRMAFEGFGYASPRDLELLYTQVNRVTDLGEDRYLVDVSYSMEITGWEGPVVVDDHILLVLFNFDGKLLADALYYA